MSSGSVSTSRPSPPGKSRAKVASKAVLDVGVGLGEDLLDPLVDLADDVEQVAAGALEVLELLGEELVPLLERRELLERQRVDPAELGQRPLGGAQPLGLLLAVEGHRRGAAPRPRPPRRWTGISWSGP